MAFCHAHYTRDVARATQNFYKTFDLTDINKQTNKQTKITRRLGPLPSEKIDKISKSGHLLKFDGGRVGNFGNIHARNYFHIYRIREFVLKPFPVICWLLNGRGIKKRRALCPRDLESFIRNPTLPWTGLPYQTSRSSLFRTQNPRWRNQMKKLISRMFPMANKQPIYESWAMMIKRTNGIAMYYVSFEIILYSES